MTAVVIAPCGRRPARAFLGMPLANDIAVFLQSSKPLLLPLFCALGGHFFVGTVL